MNRILLIFLFLSWLLPCAAQDWAAAKPGYQFVFPRDHGSHPDFKIEWWYFTGNLRSAKGDRYGYQLTFFRIGSVMQPVAASPWALRDIWMAHFAVTDVSGKKYHCADRLNRAGPGLAGASTERVWNEDWSCRLGSPETFALEAADLGFSIQLNLKSASPPVIHGRDGISQKGSTPGNASHYYSLTRLLTEGTITLGGQPMTVTGDSWMDHEFGTSFLEPGQQGWDWFSAQLDDGSALMLFQLRQTTATAPNMSAGTLIKPDGTVIALSGADFRLKSGQTWTAYPIEWEIEVPAHRITLRCRAALAAQEFRAAALPGLNYWEGAVDYRGTSAGLPVRGSGYLEMTGYGGRPMSQWFGVGH